MQGPIDAIVGGSDGGAGLAFVFELLGVDNKRGCNVGQQGQHLQGCIAIVLVAAVAAQARRLLLVCLGIKGDVGQQGQRPHGRIDMRAHHECGCSL
jgi:hypothetical protein